MPALSPDEAWRRPGFALRRLLRLTTIEPARFRPALGADEAAALGARIGPAQRAALRAGGRDAPARAILVLSPTPRSGTNFVEALIAAHPHAAASPCGLREAPFLAEADRIRDFETGFARRHARSGARIARYEMLGHAVTGFLARAAAEAPEAGAIVLKDPHSRRLELLPAVFPAARWVFVLRDGRRTIDSMARTWPIRFPGRTFADMCLEWALATEAALDRLAASPAEALCVRFEDAARDPARAAVDLWAALGLAPAPDAAARLADLPVMGSSTRPNADGVVDWTPRARDADFDPAGRPVRWPRGREARFREIAGRAQARLDAAFPVGAAAAAGPRAPAPAARAAPGADLRLSEALPTAATLG